MRLTKDIMDLLDPVEIEIAHRKRENRTVGAGILFLIALVCFAKAAGLYSGQTALYILIAIGVFSLVFIGERIIRGPIKDTGKAMVAADELFHELHG